MLSKEDRDTIIKVLYNDGLGSMIALIENIALQVHHKGYSDGYTDGYTDGYHDACNNNVE